MSRRVAHPPMLCSCGQKVSVTTVSVCVCERVRERLRESERVIFRGIEIALPSSSVCFASPVLICLFFSSFLCCARRGREFSTPKFLSFDLLTNSQSHKSVRRTQHRHADKRTPTATHVHCATTSVFACELLMQSSDPVITFESLLLVEPVRVVVSCFLGPRELARLAPSSHLLSELRLALRRCYLARACARKTLAVVEAHLRDT